MTVLSRLRSSFVTGLILVSPLAVTVFVLQFTFNRITTTLRPLVRQVTPFLATVLNYSGDIVLISQVLSAFIIAIAISLIGYLASISLGQRLFGSFERGVKLLPLVRTIYFGVRQVSESLTEPTAGYDRVVLVEYPREGVYSIGFVTNEAPSPVVNALETDLYTVFLPHSPNPTAGALIMVSDDEIRELDMPVRRGLRLLVTTGLSIDDPETLPSGPAAYSPSNSDGRDGSHSDSRDGSNLDSTSETSSEQTQAE
ncbi:DUF502 domain-containing protein [Haloferax mediterranei ATCC 33500]|uniref:DUF502 domain-containing protein n=1 Tax=Haloferax mediterranei (strain ATCC 33500 / DSM 1411 / JCM 8866 / NBRC 14739 / NCIMB 2177 / R-4) TaxID=523841 RepID=I3R1K4_HALMT|nr:DUF502 domain-containing protein [Haloferax mediterranei]AFK18114.2 hypothetical protein HFX_0378 [Haloferax mediterranei ATCC 33500]AHZ22478.1 hypothetical protein BM92_07370 [Haloferax mediterranei ATCC 33500]EMA02613.1 hypothetical protein C439_08520 [Haloferax mediterranei ATCC 33500]MDX5988204.1 DUF502 domain-containing protein [Haloferax mediterranei ATCC 33500]QCQ74647.1 DUF502 domain-containing protein [Haloferax mediterranei ATCC 33500]